MASPDSQDRRNGDDRAHWSQWANWLAGGFAIVANVVGVVQLAMNDLFILSVAAGALAIAGGSIWLWRLSNDSRPIRARSQIFALNLAMVTIGAAVVCVAALQWSAHRRESAGPPTDSSSPRTETPSPTTTPSLTPTTSPTAAPSIVPSAQNTGNGGGGDGGQRTPSKAPTTTAPPPPPPPPPAGPFTGTIRIRYPAYGETMVSGVDDLTGEVTGWKAGYQIWFSARADGGSTEIVQGPCRVEGAFFNCSDVGLPGPPGTLELLRVAVVTDATAAGLRGADRLPVETAPASDWHHVYKG